MKLSNELKSKSLVRTEILRQQDTSLSCSRLLNCRVERIIINNAVEFNFAQSHVRENKSGEIFPQYYTSGFGEIFPWRKISAIRYMCAQYVDHMYIHTQNSQVSSLVNTHTCPIICTHGGFLASFPLKSYA